MSKAFFSFYSVMEIYSPVQKVLLQNIFFSLVRLPRRLGRWVLFLPANLEVPRHRDLPEHLVHPTDQVQSIFSKLFHYI